MSSHAEPDEFLGLEASLAEVSRFRDECAATTALIAAAIARLPALEVKVMLGRHLFDDATLASVFNRRAEEQGSGRSLRIAETRPEDELSQLVLEGSTAPFLDGLYDRAKGAALQRLQLWRHRCNPVLDEPTLRNVDEATRILQRQLDEAARLACALDERLPGWRSMPGSRESGTGDMLSRAGRMGSLRPPELPARDVRFEPSENPPSAPEGADLQAEVVFLMHFNLMGLEIPTIEHCAQLICDFPDMSWEFVHDMARQSWDEARHAQAFQDRLHALGGRLGQYPADFSLWRMTAGLPLAERLAIHQRHGEWIGVDGALWAAEEYAARGDPATARLFEFVSRDEVTHVALGNKWVRRLVPEPDGVAALHEKARQIRQGGDPALKRPIFPFHRWACERAGFGPGEVDALESAHRRLGSVYRARQTRLAPAHERSEPEKSGEAP